MQREVTIAAQGDQIPLVIGSTRRTRNHMVLVQVVLCTAGNAEVQSHDDAPHALFDWFQHNMPVYFGRCL
jgi:hypothetical protein